MTTLIIIPARYASTRFPGKPLVDIAGKSMIMRVYEQCRQRYTHVCVATDDLRIYNHVESSGACAVMTSTEHQSGTDRCVEAYNKYCIDNDISFDLVINVQGDEPFINPDQLSSLEMVFNDPDVEIATLVKKIERREEIFNPNTPKVAVSIFNYALYFSRSPIPYIRDKNMSETSVDIPFYKHIGIYAYRPEILQKITMLSPSGLELAEKLEQLRWLENGYRIKVVETHFESHAVDTPEDLKLLPKFM